MRCLSLGIISIGQCVVRKPKKYLMFAALQVSDRHFVKMYVKSTCPTIIYWCVFYSMRKNSSWFHIKKKKSIFFILKFVVVIQENILSLYDLSRARNQYYWIVKVPAQNLTIGWNQIYWCENNYYWFEAFSVIWLILCQTNIWHAYRNKATQFLSEVRGN